jgi:hypothetical protein
LNGDEIFVFLPHGEPAFSEKGKLEKKVQSNNRAVDAVDPGFQSDLLEV